jgi:decaprenyl-phosphate phosphoribosyltransferase
LSVLGGAPVARPGSGYTRMGASLRPDFWQASPVRCLHHSLIGFEPLREARAEEGWRWPAWYFSAGHFRTLAAALLRFPLRGAAPLEGRFRPSTCPMTQTTPARPSRPGREKGPAAPRARLGSYLRLARPDNWFKNVFVVPGAVVAARLTGAAPASWWWPFVVAIGATCAIASANYVLNEWLDREFDRHHPEKSNRPSVREPLVPWLVYLEYVALALVGLGAAAAISFDLALAEAALLGMGAVYNVRPLRSKERVYVDVLSEAINNPIRLLIGWFSVAPGTFPPSSFLFAYWMGGAYLMGIKRYSEFRAFDDPSTAALYRRSFRHYSESKLLLAAMLYALLAVSMGSVFLVKYRIELILAVPFVCIQFAWYFAIGLKPNSAAQHPERMWREGPFALYSLFVILLLLFGLFVRIPALHVLLRQAFVVD